MFGRFSRKKKKGDVPSATSSTASDAAAAMSPTRSTRSNRGANGGRGGAGRKERRDEERRQRRQREEERRHRKSNRRQRQQRRTDRSDRRGGDGGGGGGGGGGGRGRGEQVRTGARAGAEIRLTGGNGSPEREARAARQRTGHLRDGSESPPPVKHGSRPSIENGAASRAERPDQYPESGPELRADFEDSSANPDVDSGGVADDEAAMLKSAIIEHAIYLGIDPDTDPELLHIAEESMLAPPPEGWRTMSDDSGNPFYYNESTKVSQWDHPEDNHYREIIQEMKAAKAQNDAISKSADHDPLVQKKKKDSNANLSEVKTTETAANTWDDWDDDEEDGDTGETNGGSSASTTTTARGERQQQTQTQGVNKESEPAVDLDDWDESDEDENVDNAPSAPSSSSTGMPLPLANANEDIDLEESALSKLMRTSPQTSTAARKAQSEQAAQGNGRRAVPTIPEMSDEEEDKSVVEETRATSSVSESSSSSTSRSSSSSSSLSSSSAPQDLSKAYFQAQAEARELRAELARVHAQTAEIRANQIREQKSHASRIDMLMQEIATERGIGAKHSARVFELESNVQSLEKERDFAVQRANDLIKEKEDAKAKEEHDGSEESVETTIAEIEKIAAKAQIAALEAKVKEMEEEADDLEQQTARAMQTARAAQDASRGFEKELAELRGKENAAVAQDKKSNSITDAALKEAEDKHRLEIIELRETQMTAMSNKAGEHARALTKMRSEMLVLKAELAESKAAAAVGNKVDEAEVQKMIEKATVILQAKMKVMAHELDSEKAARMAAEQREQAEKALVEAAAEAAAGEKRSLDSQISAAKAASDRKLRQLEQCLSMAEERADRAEAEAHDAHVESQLAGTLGIKVYELERDRDIQATATQAAQDAMEKARKRAANLERRNEELERSIAAQKTEHGRLTMDNASLQAEVQRLQKRLTENLKKLSLLEATSSSSTAISSLSQSSEAVPPAHRSGTPAHIREAENESRQQTLQELARLREQVHDLTTRLATRNNINSGLEVTERAALQQQLENMRATAMQQQLTSTARVRDLEQALAVAEARLEGIRHERDSALAEVSKIRVEWKELHVQLAKARVRAANEGDARVRAEADCDGLRRQLELVDPSRSALEESSLLLLQRDRRIMEGQQQKQYHRGDASSFASPSRAAAPNRVAMSPQQALVLSEQRNALLRRRANEAEVKAKTVERVLQRMIVTEAPQKEAFVM